MSITVRIYKVGDPPGDPAPPDLSRPWPAPQEDMTPTPFTGSSQEEIRKALEEIFGPHLFGSNSDTQGKK